MDRRLPPATPGPGAGAFGSPPSGSDCARVVARNEIYWANLGRPAGRRPVCVLTRDAAASVLNAVTCAPVTRTIRGIRSEVEIGLDEGLPEPCVINCDNILTVPVADLDPQPVGHLREVARAHLDRALRYALDIAY
ncbi:MAG: type II toxin-antitoxin system PemK/MazF family toxin [Acidimicrobiia bacterium]|nr:type II toxin-antitoxin system PemK/MazF family toxin [Acidimicrobiia bacterium]MYJ13557.1 type II toxin-antitoxin system PemK/MazF family toxin [Acidimicrobiia bacterium]